MKNCIKGSHLRKVENNRTTKSPIRYLDYTKRCNHCVQNSLQKTKMEYRLREPWERA